MIHMSSSPFFSFLLFQGPFHQRFIWLKTFLYCYSAFPTLALTAFPFTAEVFESGPLFNIHSLLARLLTDVRQQTPE